MAMTNSHDSKPITTPAIWLVYLASMLALFIPHWLRLDAVLMVVACAIVVVWTLVGRRWFRSGFYQAFDMLAMFVYFSAFVAFCVAAYRLMQ